MSLQRGSTVPAAISLAISIQENSTVIVPPDTTEEEFNLKWEEISSSVIAFPVEYALTAQGEELDTPLLPIVCHRIKVQRYTLLPTIKYYPN